MQRDILLDTNFLMVPGLFGVDVFAEIERICDFPYRLCVLDKSSLELDKIIREQGGKDKAAATLAKQLILRNQVFVIPTICEDHYVDDLLVRYDKNHLVATNDLKLIARLKAQHIDVLRLRQKKIITLER